MTRTCIGGHFRSRRNHSSLDLSLPRLAFDATAPEVLHFVAGVAAGIPLALRSTLTIDEEIPTLLLTISTTHQPATDLGYLLHKHPERGQTFPLNVGLAHNFYSESNAERCTAALMLEVDPIGLARGRGQSAARVLEYYGDDQPAVGEVFRSALSGLSRQLPELVETLLPLHPQRTPPPRP